MDETRPHIDTGILLGFVALAKACGVRDPVDVAVGLIEHRMGECATFHIKSLKEDLALLESIAALQEERP